MVFFQQSEVLLDTFPKTLINTPADEFKNATTPAKINPPQKTFKTKFLFDRIVRKFLNKIVTFNALGSLFLIVSLKKK